MSRFGGFPGGSGGSPGGISIGPGGVPVDRFGMPLVIDPNSDLHRRLFGIPNPNTDPPQSSGVRVTPPSNEVQPGLGRPLNQVGLGQNVRPAQGGAPGPPGAGASTPASTLPPIFRFMLQQGQDGPQSVQDFVASDPRRTVAPGTLAGLEGLISQLFGGGGGLNVNRFNESLEARQSSALADTNAGFDARGLALRQDLARRGILNSGLAAGAEVDLEGARTRGLGAARAGILGVGAQVDLQSQQLSANQALERRRLIESLLRGNPGIANILGGLAA